MQHALARSLRARAMRAFAWFMATRKSLEKAGRNDPCPQPTRDDPLLRAQARQKRGGLAEHRTHGVFRTSPGPRHFEDEEGAGGWQPKRRREKDESCGKYARRITLSRRVVAKAALAMSRLGGSAGG